MSPLRIGFINTGDAADPNYMSGAPSSILGAFERAGAEVIRLFPLKKEASVRAASAVGNLFARVADASGRFYDYSREPIYTRILAQALQSRLERTKVDALFTQRSACVSSLKTSLPVYTASDQPYPCLYEGYISKPAQRSVRVADIQSKDAIRVATRIFVPSQWAKERYGHYHPGSEQKVDVIPWGANLSNVPARADVDRLIAAKSSETRISLCFVGTDWKRKGGEDVLATAKLLAARGLDVRLTIIGVDLSRIDGLDLASLRPGIEIINMPYIDRAFADGEKQYLDVLREAHFMFVPSRYEAYGHVFCEAAAYGVPSVSRSVGGITEIIRDGSTGIALPAEATPVEFARRLESLFRDQASYARTATAARDDFEGRLSWDVFAQRVLDLIDRDCSERRRA